MSQMIVLAGTAEFATKEGRDACLASSAQYQEPARGVDKTSAVYDETFTPRPDFF